MRRNLAIAGAVAELAPRASILVATGSDDVERLGVPDRVDVLKLPGLRKLGNGRYGPRRLRVPDGEMTAVRAQILAAAAESFRPAVVLADKHPLGAVESLRSPWPRRRAVLQLAGHVVKCYAKEVHFDAAALGLRVSSGLGSFLVPRFEAADASLRVTAQALLEGASATGPQDSAAAAGAVLAVLHEQRSLPSLEALPPAPPSRQLEAAAASAGLAAAVAPGLAPRLQKLVRRLEDSRPDVAELVPSHGDFNARQLLVTGEGLAVTDFDEFCLAPRALDLATYASYVLRADVRDAAAVEAVLDELVAAYGGRPDGLGWYLSTMLLRRAPRPFRYLEPAWPRRVEELVGAAEGALRA